jgi:hypothetical protein
MLASMGSSSVASAPGSAGSGLWRRVLIRVDWRLERRLWRRGGPDGRGDDDEEDGSVNVGAKPGDEGIVTVVVAIAACAGDGVEGAKPGLNGSSWSRASVSTSTSASASASECGSGDDEESAELSSWMRLRFEFDGRVRGRVGVELGDSSGD